MQLAAIFIAALWRLAKVDGISSEAAMSVKSHSDTLVQPDDRPRPARPRSGRAYPAPDSAELEAPSLGMPWPAQVIYWAGIVIVVAASFWLQIQINNLGRNAFETLLVVLSVALEFGLLWLWNRRFPAFWRRVMVGPLKRLLR
jgi:hypothetical protein